MILFCFLDWLAGSDVRLFLIPELLISTGCFNTVAPFAHFCLQKEKMQFKQTSHPDWPYYKTNIYPGKYLKNATLEPDSEWFVISPE